ncbi:unnamed protein product, partial [Caretta caretta]
HNNSV